MSASHSITLRCIRKQSHVKHDDHINGRNSYSNQYQIDKDMKYIKSKKISNEIMNSKLILFLLILLFKQTRQRLKLDSLIYNEEIKKL